MKFIVYFFSLFLLFNAKVAFAQANEEITFEVVDSLKNSVTNASFLVLGANNKIISHGYTDSSGHFKVIINSNNHVFKLEVSHINYKKYIRSFKYNESNRDLLNQLILSSNNNILNEVVISQQRKTVAIEGDKLMFDITAISNYKNIAVDDLLDLLPFITVGEDGIKILNENMAIFINNKVHPVYNNVSSLKNLPSISIKTIEILLTPTARQGGLTRTLNITLKENFFLGWNGRSNVDASIASLKAYTQIGYWHNRFGLNLAVNNQTGSFKNNLINQINNKKDCLFVITDQKIIKFNTNANYSLNGYYILDKHMKNTFDFSISKNVNYYSNNIDANNRLIFTSSEERINEITSKSDNNQSNNISLNYTLKFNEKGKELYVLSNVNNEKEINYVKIENISNASLNTFKQNSENSQNSIEFIYQNNQKKYFKFSTGSKFVNRKYSAIINQIQTSDTNEIYHDDAVSGIQNLYNGFVDINYNKGKMAYKLGIKNEYFSQTFNNIESSFFNFIPTVSISYSSKQNFNIIGSYLREVRRPSFSYLNPVIVPTSSFISQSGQEFLKPQVRHVFRAQTFFDVKSINAGMSIDYSFFKNFIDDVSLINYETKGITQSSINVRSNNAVTLAISLETSIGNNLKISHQSNGSYISIDSDYSLKTMFSGYLYERLSYRISKTQRVDFTCEAFSPNLLPQGKDQSMAYPNISFRYSKFINILDKLPSNISVRVSNPWLIKGLPGYTILDDETLSVNNRRLSFNPIVSLSFFISFDGKSYGNQNFTKERYIENNDIKSKN